MILSQDFESKVSNLVRLFEKFKELNSNEKFQSSLTHEIIGDNQYKHVLKVWNTFQTKMVKDFHDLYLKYILLLAEAFLKFRNKLVALNWDAMLNVKKVELNLLKMLTCICSLEKA